MDPRETTSVVVIREILTLHQEIHHIHIVEFPFKPVLQERLELTQTEERQIARALAIRELLGLQFWDALLLTCLSNTDFSPRLLEQVKAHNTDLTARRLSARGSALEDHLARTPGVNIAFSSKVVLATGEERHLPLLDFHCANNAANLALSCAVIQWLEIRSGYLLESGDSYHFYGSALLTLDEYVRFIGLALQYSPIIDKVWIAHQLREMTSALRITPKRGITPFLVKRVETMPRS
jgi:hypothetical protein